MLTVISKKGTKLTSQVVYDEREVENDVPVMNKHDMWRT